ncbi:MAG TPA: FliH/SctL family protein [Terracidiphilus sp.]|jgi:flagellar assembly protein FliH|nr:FliH/SctL family protein [Terracidiphilus sp.]
MITDARQTGAPAAVQTFPYAELPELDSACVNWDLPRVDAEGRPLRSTPAVDPGHAEDFDSRLAEESRRSFEAGRTHGIEEGRVAERAAHVPAEQHRAEQLRRLLDSLAGERDRYLQSVEHETVRLALAIAARILRREAQVDPLLLMGAVRVALGQLAAATEARLHVPAADAELWKEAIELLPHAPVRPVVVADDSMRLGDCRLEASLGQVDLGLGSQLGEIERGFFDRVPAASAFSAETLP